jgi:hypothetical protein
MAFISFRSRLTKVLAGAARGKKGSKGGEGQVKLPNVDTGLFHLLTFWSLYFYS